MAKPITPLPWAQSDSRPDLVFADNLGMIVASQPVAQFKHAEDARFVIRVLDERDAMRAALQRLIDDMHDAGETHGDNGVMFDSVAEAAAALVKAGGSLSWYPSNPEVRSSIGLEWTASGKKWHADTSLGRVTVSLRSAGRGQGNAWLGTLPDGRRVATGLSSDECRQAAEFHVARLVAEGGKR